MSADISSAAKPHPPEAYIIALACKSYHLVPFSMASAVSVFAPYQLYSAALDL